MTDGFDGFEATSPGSGADVATDPDHVDFDPTNDHDNT